MSHYCAYYNTASIYERISSLRQHIHLICDITATIWVITCTVQAVSHPLCLWQHTRHMCGIVCIIQDIASSLFDHKPPSWGHHTHFIRYRVHCICVIIPTLSMISQPLYIWYHIQYMEHILTTIFMTSYPLCMTSQHCVLIRHHWAYVWHHLYYRRCHIHSITPSHNLYDFTSIQAWHHTPCIRHRTKCIFVIRTFRLISHTILYDITPTISVTSYALYITSYPLLMSSHYYT